MENDIFIRDSIDNTINEDCMEFVEDPHNIGVSILIGGLTKNNEPYALFVNGSLVDNNGYGKDTEKEGKRISLSDPKYLQYNKIFNKEEKELFMTILKNNWQDIQETYDWIYGEGKVKINKVCPNYLELESED